MTRRLPRVPVSRVPGQAQNRHQPRKAGVAVHAENLRVIRGRRAVLHGVEFSLPTGVITGLLGPSGCGKTTLLRAIAGVQRRVSGRLDVLGQPAGSADLRSRIGYVTQEPAVYTDISVRENLRYFAAAQRLPASQRTEEVDRVLHAVDLHGQQHQVVERLSGGQRARVSLAAALLGTPPLLLLDEPTVGLDPVLRQDLWALFTTLTGGKVTLLISSHVMDEAEQCERILFLRAGRLLADGPTSDVLARAGATRAETAFLTLAGHKPPSTGPREA